MLVMLPGSWQCAIINYPMVVFLCRKWKSVVGSRTRRRGSFSWQSTCSFAAAVVNVTSCCGVPSEGGTGVRPRLAQEVPDLQSWDLWGLYRDRQLCACPSLQFFGFHLCTRQIIKAGCTSGVNK